MWTPFIVVIVVFGIILLAVIITLAVICTLGRKKSFKTDPGQQTYPAEHTSAIQHFSNLNSERNPALLDGQKFGGSHKIRHVGYTQAKSTPMT